MGAAAARSAGDLAPPPLPRSCSFDAAGAELFWPGGLDLDAQRDEDPCQMSGRDGAAAVPHGAAVTTARRFAPADGGSAGDKLALDLQLDATGNDAAAGAASPLAQLQSWVWSRGSVCILLAAFIFSLSALCVKLTAGRVPVLEITLLRSGISFAVSTGLMRARRIAPMFGARRSWGWLVPRGLFGAAAMISFYGSILLLPLADSMALFFANPALTAVAAWAIRGEALGLLGVVGCLLSLAGMVVLTHPPMLFGGHEDWGPRRVWGTVLGAVAACCAAGAFICIRFIGRAEPSLVIATYFHMATLALSSAPLALGWPQRAVPLGWFDTGLMLGVAATSFLGQLFLTRGFQLESAAKSSALNFSQVLYSYCFGVAIFGKRLLPAGLAGTGLIAAGIVCVSARTAPVQPSERSDAVRDIAAAGLGSFARAWTRSRSTQTSPRPRRCTTRARRSTARASSCSARAGRPRAS